MDYVRMVHAMRAIQKDLDDAVLKAMNGEFRPLTEADQDFLSGLKIDPENEGR